MSINWHGIIQLYAPLIKDDNEDKEDDGVHCENSLSKRPDPDDQIKRTFFMNAIFAISHFVKLASARSHECRQQKVNQRQFREWRKQTQHGDLIPMEITVV